MQKLSKHTLWPFCVTRDYFEATEADLKANSTFLFCLIVHRARNLLIKLVFQGPSESNKKLNSWVKGSVSLLNVTTAIWFCFLDISVNTRVQIVIFLSYLVDYAVVLSYKGRGRIRTHFRPFWFSRSNLSESYMRWKIMSSRSFSHKI
jgi:hypothetical protein